MRTRHLLQRKRYDSLGERRRVFRCLRPEEAGIQQGYCGLQVERKRGNHLKQGTLRDDVCVFEYALYRLEK